MLFHSLFSNKAIENLSHKQENLLKGYEIHLRLYSYTLIAYVFFYKSKNV